jgi:hypothetical protein
MVQKVFDKNVKVTVIEESRLKEDSPFLENLSIKERYK